MLVLLVTSLFPPAAFLNWYINWLWHLLYFHKHEIVFKPLEVQREMLTLVTILDQDNAGRQHTRMRVHISKTENGLFVLVRDMGILWYSSGKSSMGTHYWAPPTWQCLTGWKPLTRWSWLWWTCKGASCGPIHLFAIEGDMFWRVTDFFHNFSPFCLRLQAKSLSELLKPSLYMAGIEVFSLVILSLSSVFLYCILVPFLAMILAAKRLE